MTLRTEDGTPIAVQNNRPFERTARTFNLTVAGLHTYYVLAGRTPLLVHNSACSLLLHERAGGHAIARHVGKSDAFLKARGLPKASTFNDLAAAEKATGDNIAKNQAAIQQWLSSAATGKKQPFETRWTAQAERSI